MLFDVADPRVRDVTVLRAEVSPDLRQAKVFVSIMGNPSERKRTMDGLVHATGFLQARVAARLQTRFTPVLSFRLDDSVKKSAEIGRLIDEAVASDRRDAEAAPPGDLGPDHEIPNEAETATETATETKTEPAPGPDPREREVPDAGGT
ncbi:MAG: 30S ribosome-binding factor RbfA [Isosphaeraceae bacterium]